MVYLIIAGLLFLVFWYSLFNDFFAALKSIPSLFRHFDYVARDFVGYFREKRWQQFNDSGIVLFGGLFGTGKTLSMTDYVCRVWRRYRNIEVVSNVTFKTIPYTPFQYFEQLSDPVPDGVTRIFVCDEFGSLFNSRNYAKNSITETEYLTVLNQLRKERKLLLITTQRYGMLDKVFRQVSKVYYECHRFWRFYWRYAYDPYDLEYSNDPRLVRPLSVFPSMTFATNAVYSQYDTKEFVHSFENIMSITNRSDTSATVNADYQYSSRARKKYYKR